MVDGNENLAEFKIEAGETLQLKGVSAKVLREFIEEMGGFEKVLENQSGDEALANRLFMYVAGFGVRNELPEYANDELELLGIKSKSERVKKAHWIRSILNNKECSDLLSRIFLLSVE